jgi:AcrR family transcriptional regulator
VRRKLTDTSHPDETLTDEFWLRFGDNPQPAMHDKIIFLTIEQVKAKGPWDFNSAAICQRLGITNPMVNHYFGNRDGLLAAGLFEVYRRYIDHLGEAVAAAPREPKARLEAWMREKVNRTCEMGGWATMLNSPMSALRVTEVFQEEYRDEVQRLFEYNLMRLGYLIRDVQQGRVTEQSSVLSSEERAALLGDQELSGMTASVAWSMLGSATWLAGQHVPSSRIVELWARSDDLISAHIRRVIASVELNSL